MKTTNLWKVLCLALCLFLLIGLTPSVFAQSEEDEEEEPVQARPNPMAQTIKESQTGRTLNMNVQKLSVKDEGGEMAMPASDGSSMELQGETQGIGNAQIGDKTALPMEKNLEINMK